MAFSNCHKCGSYNRGKGTAACFKCPKYKDVILATHVRPKIITEVFPQAILEQVADTTGPNGEDVIALMRSLPINEMVVILLRYYGNLTIDEISNAIEVGTATVSRRLKSAMDKLRDNLSEV